MGLFTIWSFKLSENFQHSKTKAELTTRLNGQMFIAILIGLCKTHYNCIQNCFYEFSFSRWVSRVFVYTEKNSPVLTEKYFRLCQHAFNISSITPSYKSKQIHQYLQWKNNNIIREQWNVNFLKKLTSSWKKYD
jgi:hypothetical protein